MLDLFRRELQFENQTAGGKNFKGWRQHCKIVFDIRMAQPRSPYANVGAAVENDPGRSRTAAFMGLTIS
jgi:hypothetical protein